jgi:cell division protein YceG involved in septum cleavage
VTSIDAALAPDTESGYLYFLAIPDGDGAHVFTKTLEEHNAKRREYGYD